MVFDTTINLGTLLQTIAMVGSFVYFLWRLSVKLEIIDTKQVNTIHKINDIEKELEKITLVIIEQARQNARLDNFDVRLQEMSNRVYDKKLISN